MATEEWLVNIPGSLKFSNFDRKTGQLLNSQTDSVTGARIASKRRSGNWERKRPVTLNPTPYDLSNYVARVPVGKSVIDYPEYNLRQVYEGSLSTAILPSGWKPASVIDQLRNEALIDALVRLKDQKFNTGVAIAEANGVASMGYDLMRTIAATRRRIRKADLKGAYDVFRRHIQKPGDTWKAFKSKYSDSLTRADMLSNVPSNWLYYHFGILPTLSDINSLHEDWFRKHAVPGGNTWHGKVRGSAKYVTERRDSFQLSHYCIANSLAMQDVQSMRVVLSVSPVNDFLARLAQMGAMNVPEAAWNGTPFSWVVDYFYSMGDWLSVLDAGMGYEFGNTVESFRRITRWGADSFTTTKGPQLSSVQATPYRVRETLLNRRVVVELYPPMYRVRPMAKLKGPSLKQFANMTSVLASLFGGALHSPRI